MQSSVDNSAIMLACLLQRIKRRFSVTSLVADVVTVLVAVALAAEIVSRMSP